MSLRDFGVLVLVCLVWACNNIISKIVVAHWGVPPLFYAAVRFAIVAAVTLPWLLPAPRPARDCIRPIPIRASSACAG